MPSQPRAAAAFPAGFLLEPLAGSAGRDSPSSPCRSHRPAALGTPPGRAPLGREEPDADGSPRGMSFPGWMSWKSCLAAAPSSLWGSPLPVSRCPACGCPLHVVSWLRAALPPRSSPLPGSLRGHSRASRCPPGRRGHSYLRDCLGQGLLRPLLRPPGGSPGAQRGQERERLDQWGLGG